MLSKIVFKMKMTFNYRVEKIITASGGERAPQSPGIDCGNQLKSQFAEAGACDEVKRQAAGVIRYPYLRQKGLNQRGLRLRSLSRRRLR